MENSTQLIEATFFDNKRYDLASVGRYKLNKKLGWRRRLLDKVLDAPLVDTSTGEIILPAGTRIDDKAIDIIEQSEIFSGVGLKEVFIRVKEQVLKLICTADIPEKHRTVTVEDVLASFGYLLNLMDGLGTGVDIDHLGNRRVRSVGELLQNQFRIGLARMERVVKERMTIQDVDVITPQALINIRPVVAAITVWGELALVGPGHGGLHHGLQALCGGGNGPDDRTAQLGRQGVHVDLGVLFLVDVALIQGHHHGNAQLQQLCGEEQAAAEVCGVHNVDDHIGIFVLYVGAGDALLTGEGRHGIGAGQVHSDQLLLPAVIGFFDGVFLFLYRDTRPVAHLFVPAC